MSYTVTPTTILSKPLVSAAYLVANSAKFRSVVGASTVALALEHIELLEAIDDDARIPRAIVTFGDNYTSKKITTGGWENGGHLVVSFEILPSGTQGSPWDEILFATEAFGKILEEMQESAGQGTGATFGGVPQTNLDVIEMPIIQQPARFNLDLTNPSPDDLQYFMAMQVGLVWRG